MEYALEGIALCARGEFVRGEATAPQLVGEGKGIARFNAHYRRAAEAFLARVARLRLPEGRYAARLDYTAEVEGSVLTVTLVWRLCRRGRVLEEGRAVQRWEISRKNPHFLP